MTKTKAPLDLVIIPQENIEGKIFIIRGKKIMIDRDLARLYGVATKRLNEQVKRNKRRFPEDFMFRLAQEERDELVAICDRFEKLKHSSSSPLAFTELGVAMLSSVLNSERAISINIQIMRAFARLREVLSSHIDLKKKIDAMEKKYDHQFKIVFNVIEELLEPSAKPKKQIGFHEHD